MGDIINQILSSIIVSFIGSGILVFLTKSWISEKLKNSIKSEYDLKLESHKAQLKATSDVEIEKIKYEINIAITKHSVMFSKLHEQRAIVIAETYDLLKKLYIALSRYTAIYEPPGAPTKEERRNDAAKALTAFREYIEIKDIYFPKMISGTINDINNELFQVYHEFLFKVEMPRGNDQGDAWLAIHDKMTSRIKTALENLGDEFRKLLGDDSGLNI